MGLNEAGEDRIALVSREEIIEFFKETGQFFTSGKLVSLLPSDARELEMSRPTKG